MQPLVLISLACFWCEKRNWFSRAINARVYGYSCNQAWENGSLKSERKLISTRVILVWKGWFCLEENWYWQRSPKISFSPRYKVPIFVFRGFCYLISILIYFVPSNTLCGPKEKYSGKKRPSREGGPQFYHGRKWWSPTINFVKKLIGKSRIARAPNFMRKFTWHAKT